MQNTTSDAQCHVNFFPKGSFAPTCWATDRANPSLNLNSASCAYYKGRCYSTTAKQCATSRDCGLGASGECVNKRGGSSLNCRHSGFLGACQCGDKPQSAGDWLRSKLMPDIKS